MCLVIGIRQIQRSVWLFLRRGINFKNPKSTLNKFSRWMVQSTLLNEKYGYLTYLNQGKHPSKIGWLLEILTSMQAYKLSILSSKVALSTGSNLADPENIKQQINETPIRNLRRRSVEETMHWSVLSLHFLASLAIARLSPISVLEEFLIGTFFCA